MKFKRGALTIEFAAPLLRCHYGPFEAQREGMHNGPGFEYEDWFGPVRTRRRDAVADAERMGPGAVVRNTRNGNVVWRVYGLDDRLDKW
jgi:hypothetical protein